MPFRHFLRNTQYAIHRRAVHLLLALFVLLAGTFSVITPAFETPDEIWHYAFIHHLVTERSLPVSEPNTQAMWRQQGVQAPGYYLAAALLTAPIDQSDFPALYGRANPHAAIGQPGAVINRNYLIHHADEGFPWRGAILALHVARLFSVLLGAVTVYATYRTLDILLGKNRALLGAAFVAFIPQFVFISAAASNDNAINAGAALVIWWLVDVASGRGQVAGGRSSVTSYQSSVNSGEPPHSQFTIHHSPFTIPPHQLLLFGLLLGLALLAKLSSLALVGLSGLVILWLAWRGRSWRLLADAAVWSGLPALLIAGWWYIRNWRLYGDFLAWNVWEANILLRVIPADWRVIAGELGSLERSFWGLFGWLNLPYPEWAYAAFRGVEILLAAGLVVGVLRIAYSVVWKSPAETQRRREKTQTAASLSPTKSPPGGAARSPFTIHHSPFTISLALPLLWLFLLLLSWLNFMRVAPAAQGRYFFPAAAALGLLFVWGVEGWGRRVGPRLGWGTVAGLLALSAATPFWLIGPAYQPPEMPVAQAAETLAVFGAAQAQIELLAASAQPESLRPGDTATVRLAWRSRAAVTTDYSIFLHLVDDAGLIVAQLDTMPGGGLRPTSGWEIGGVLHETYAVTIPPAAYTPNQARWQVGLYDHRTQARLSLQARLPLRHPGGDSFPFGAATLAAAPGGIPNPLAVDFADNLSLVGYAFEPRVLRPGEEMTVTLYWQARGPVTGDYTLFAHILDDDLTMHGGQDVGPAVATDRWQPGEVVETVHTFAVSPTAPSGLYQFEIGLYTQPDFARLRLLDATGAEGADRYLLGPVRVLP